jgi:2,3-dihydroxybenzoate-AMP ligase
MLDGFTPWPPELAQRFRAAGYWEGLTLCCCLAAPLRFPS